MWRVIVGLLVVIVLLGILGLVLKAVRWLLVVALVLAVLTAVGGSLTRKNNR